MVREDLVFAANGYNVGSVLLRLRPDPGPGETPSGVKAEVINYVLRKPPLEQRQEIEKAIDQSLTALDLLLAGDMEKAMMKIHARPPRPKPPKPEKAPEPGPQETET